MKYNKFRFDEITLNYDKKRIPLSAMERTKRQGAFRYFGAQGVIDYVDDYIFDGKYLLIAEDGENLKSKRQNIAQIVEGKFWVNNHAHIVQCNDKCILEYLAYLINGKDVSGYITGSAQPKLSQANLNAMEFDIPSIKEQQDILSILLPIEQKIRINKEINNNLAEQSQAIFAEFMCKYPYVLSPLGDMAEIIDCLHSKKPKAVNGTTYQLLQLNNITDSGFLDLSSKYYISKSDYENWTRKCEIVEGDCVITNVGRIGAVSQAPNGTHAAMGRNMTCIRLRNDKPFYSYLITALLSPHIRREIMKNTDEGTIMGALNVKNIPLLLFPMFALPTMNALEDLLSPIRKAIEQNYLSNQMLSLLRDSLLPRLMSGELDVSNIEI